jgi:hypothetical protein
LSKKGLKTSATSKRRPPRSRLPNRDEALRLLAVSVIPIQLWTIIQMLREMPVLLLRLGAWDLIGVMAYIEAVALLESLLLWLFVIGLASLLPAGLFGINRIVQGTMIILAVSLWAVSGQSYRTSVFGWTAGQFLLWLPFFLLSFGLPLYLLRSHAPAQAFIQKLVDRLLPLSALYLVLAAAGLVIVVIRNITGAL